MNQEDLEREQKIQRESSVYIDPRARVLFTKVGETDCDVIIGGVTSPYYNDARTGLMRYKISKKYFSECRVIDDNNLSLDPDLELDTMFNMNYYRVKGADMIDNDYWRKNVSNNPCFMYLDISAELIKVNKSKYETLYGDYLYA